MPEVDDESAILDVFFGITNKPSKLSYSEIAKSIKEFVPTNPKSKNRCLENYTDLEEIKTDFDFGDITKFTAKKDGQDVFIKLRSTRFN